MLLQWDKLLATEVFHYFLVFTRFAAAFGFMPFFASTYVPRRIRLLFALAVCFAVTPLLSPLLPAMPQSVGGLFYIIIIEVTIGLFLGFFPYFILAAVDLTGQVSAQATSFANATAFDPTTQVQSTVLTTFLTLIALVLIAVTGVYQIMFTGIVASYKLFPVGQEVLLGDMSKTLAQTLQSAFVCGFKISAPFILMMIVLYSAMGVMSRLMPQLNILFVMMPLQVYLGLALLMMSLPLMMMWFLRYFEDLIKNFAL